jgi:hypothetical protein
VVATLAVVAVPTETAHHFWVSVYTGAARVNDALLHAQFPAPAARKEERFPSPHAFREAVHNIGRPHLRVTDARAPFYQIRSRSRPAHRQIVDVFNDPPSFFLRHDVENTGRNSPFFQRHTAPATQHSMSVRFQVRQAQPLAMRAPPTLARPGREWPTLAVPSHDARKRVPPRGAGAKRQSSTQRGDKAAEKGQRTRCQEHRGS